VRVPLSWLEDFAPIGVDARDDEAVGRLVSLHDSLGLGVVGAERVGEGLEDVVVARVLEVAPIEGADRIRRVVVDAGGPEPTEVVCGAWNFGVGDVVPLARVGAELPGGLRIGRRRLRGVVSDGMLCSGAELGLSQDREGILVLASPGGSEASLPEGFEPGRPLVEHLGAGRDVVLDLAVEPNRPDALSVAGVARDLAAALGVPFALPEPAPEEGGAPASSLASVRVLEPRLCPHFVGLVLTGLRVAPSPPLVARRLTLAGMRAINNVVDASNYVMLELGQPTHPYDLDRLGGHGLVVRAARPGEELVTLDGVRRELGRAPARPDDPVAALDCVICDAEDTAVGVAGVMGGAASEIGADTERVLLESAWFLPVAVGRTARRLGLRSEASVRFERGCDRGGVVRAARRVAELVQRGAREAGLSVPLVAPGLLEEEPLPAAPRRVAVRVGRVNALLGTDLDAGGIARLLEPVGFVPAEGAPAPGSSVVELLVPSFRPDVVLEVDVAEEVARRYGYMRLPRRQRRSPYVGRLAPRQRERRELRRLLAGLGAHEAWTPTILDPADEARAGLAPGAVRLANPMAREESSLRTSLLPGLLGALRRNSGHRNAELRLFEVGHVFSPAPEAGGRPGEHEHAALALGWQGDDAAAAVRAWRTVADRLGVEPARLEAEVAAGLHPARSARIVGWAAGSPVVLGRVGEVAPAVVRAFDLPHERVGWLELDLDALAAAGRRAAAARPVSRFPSSDVDLAFVLDEGVPAGDLEDVLREAGGELLESVRLFDVYRGPALPLGTRGLAYRLRLCAPDRTLSAQEVAEARERCVAAARDRLGASLRS
jgi:phenylalanyl-tRNA synthetase beta chain